MTTDSLLGLLKRHLLLVVACGLLGVLVAVSVASFMVTPSYRVTTRLYVSGSGANADERLKNGEHARTHVASYTDLINSNDLLQATREKMGMPPSQDESYRDLADSITATNPLDTVVIYVSVEDTSPQRAQAVATAIGEVYNPVVARLEDAGQKQSPVQINVYSAPAVPKEPYSPSQKLYAVVGLALGLAVGTAIAWLIERRPSSTQRGRRSDQVWPDSWGWDPDPHEVVVRPIRELGSTGAIRPVKEERDAAAEQRSAAQ